MTVLAGDRTELSAGRRAALLNRRAVAMIGFGNGKVNWVWWCLNKAELPKKEKICSTFRPYSGSNARTLVDSYADSYRSLTTVYYE